MARLILITLALALVASAVLALQTCDHSRPVAAAQKSADLSAVVALPNGSVMTAAKGTVGRDMVDWLASSDKTERYFELGGKEFDGRSIEPTIESKVRIERGIAILKAHPDVTVSVIGYSSASGNPAADMTLSKARADWIVKALRDGGVPSDRLSAEGRGSANPIGDEATAAGRARDERVAMILRHER